MTGRYLKDNPPQPHPLRQSASAAQHSSISTEVAQPHERDGQLNNVTAARPSAIDIPRPSSNQPKAKHASRRSDESSGSHAAMLTDAKNWFDRSNNNPTATFDVSPPDVNSYLEKRESSGDETNHDIPLMSPQLAPPFIPPSGSFLPPALMRDATHSSSSEDYRSVIDDLTIENKRLKEQLKRYRQNANRDVLENEKLFEIKVHGLPRRKKQELEATLRDFAASLGDTASADSASQRKREKSVSSKEHSSHPMHHHHHNSAGPYASSGSRSKYASNSSSRSRPVDSAYASMSTGANSSRQSQSRTPFGGSKARASSEQKVERYLNEIPEGLYPHYGFNSLGDKEKKKLIVRRLEQLFTGKIGGRYTRQGRTSAPQSGDSAVRKATALAPDESMDSSSGADKSGSRSGSSGDGGSVPAISVSAHAPAPTALPASLSNALSGSSNFEPAREARIQQRHSGKHSKSRDNGSASNSNSNGDEAGNGNGNGSGHSIVNTASGNGTSTSQLQGKLATRSTIPDQRPTRLLDLDPDRVQVPADNMEYIRHLGLVPPEIGPKSTSKMIDVSPDADGWVYLNLLSNLAQLHILNVAPDFIRQAVVEKSTKFQLSPDGQKIRWRGGTDGTKFSSDGSTGNRSQHSQSTDLDDGSDDVGQRKRQKTSGNGSASALSSGKKQSKFGAQGSVVSSSFHYKPLFAHQKTIPMLTSGEELSSMESDLPETSGANDDSQGDDIKSRNRSDTKGKGNSKSTSNSNSNSNGGVSRYSMSRSNSSGVHKKRKSDGVLVFYSGMPFCTDLAGDSSGEGSPATNETSSGAVQESMDEALQGRPTMHRSTSGSNIPFRPLTDYLSLSNDEWAGLGLLGIGTVGRKETPCSAQDNMSSSASYISSTSNQEEIDDDLIVLDYSSETDASSVHTDGQPFEASGISRVYPEDHFRLSVKTKRPFHPSGSINAAEDYDDEDDNTTTGDDTFSMASLANRVAALKRQSAPVSAAVAMKNKAPSVIINYLTVVYDQRQPSSLPKPAMFYPPFSSTSESEGDEDMFFSEVIEEDDESLLASSSVISRRANPHHSVDNASLPSPVLMSSGEDGDVEADESKEIEMEDSA
ncbi:hypothetical protein SBRCBS47491_004816 [Sporothrix bragantina]|uniref:Frequency clock protein n=1 Tax=Sporothrix bragantina TaxID=671064 RepID=A0ABP0BRS3_9PEZI